MLVMNDFVQLIVVVTCWCGAILDKMVPVLPVEILCRSWPLSLMILSLRHFITFLFLPKVILKFVLSTCLVVFKICRAQWFNPRILKTCLCHLCHVESLLPSDYIRRF